MKIEEVIEILENCGFKQCINTSRNGAWYSMDGMSNYAARIIDGGLDPKHAGTLTVWGHVYNWFEHDVNEYKCSYTRHVYYDLGRLDRDKAMEMLEKLASDTMKGLAEKKNREKRKRLEMIEAL